MTDHTPRSVAVAPRSATLRRSSPQVELVEAITHLAFYVGWPKAMTAVTVARQVFGETSPASS